MCTMPHPDLSSTNSSATKESRVNENTEKFEDDSNVKSAKCVSNDCSSPDRCLRDRVLKEVGLTSSAFIGPAFPPETSTAKCDIEDSLSLFYKELEKIDTPDGGNDNDNPKGDVPIPPTSKNNQNVPDGKIITTMTPAETNSFHNNSGQRESSWPHWYRNEPYHHRRPVPSSVSTQWPYPPPPNRPPFPRFHRPTFPHQPQQSAYQTQQNPPLRSSVASSNSGMKNQYYDEFIHPAFPPPDICNHPSRGFQGNPTPHFGRDDQGYSNKGSEDVTGWSQGRRDEWSWCDEDDRPQRFISENKQWQQQHPYQPHDNTLRNNSASVLILMRGLPGSGKTTLARELLSIGPSGVILSTDDYFAQKDGYHYDLSLLGAAHEWNQNRANDAMKDGCSPVIIDNTNLQAWEMKPYVKMALERGYKVDFHEPDTYWKFDPYELEKRNKHGVPQEKIAQMMDRFSSSISIDIVMRSEEPAHVNQRRLPEQLQIRKKYY